MKREFSSIASHTYDVIVIGGGIVGAGIARDATLRGLDTLLLDKDDFGCGTTSKSTRLAHGGLRYLRQLEFGLVRQDLSEREVLMRIAPHLVHPVSFVIPVHSLSLNVAMALGVTLYDVISFDKTLPNHSYLNSVKTLEAEPGLRMKGLKGSYVYYDCQIPFAERLNLENALAASEGGATVVNHASVTGMLRDGSAISGVEVRDELSGNVARARGRIVVNAAGHWVDAVKNMAFTEKPPYLRRTKGAHIVVPQVSTNALVLFSPVDGRLFFVIPWQGYSLVGTTDTDYDGDLDNVYASAADVDYILDGLHIAFPGIRVDDVYYAYAGLRSLARKPGRSASDTSRSHELIDHKRRDGLAGMVTVLGGKITAYRAVARDAVDMICRKLAVKSPCVTDKIDLPGAPALSRQEIIAISQQSHLPEEAVANLASLYGSRCREVLDLAAGDDAGKQALSPGGADIVAQVWHAVQCESCMTLSDFMLRRSAVGLRKDQGMDAVPTVAGHMKKLLTWNEVETRHQIEEYRRAAEQGQRFRTA